MWYGFLITRSRDHLLLEQLSNQKGSKMIWNEEKSKEQLKAERAVEQAKARLL